MFQAHTRRPVRGLTLIELMVAIAVAAVLLSLAAPSFKQALGRSRLSSTASELTAAVQLARAEAIRSNRRVTLCRSDDGSACSSSSSTWSGWILFVDTDSNGTRGNTEPVVKSATFDSPVTVLSSAAITTAGERITFRGDGTARNSSGQLLSGTLAVCVTASDPTDNVREVSLAFGSRTLVRKRNAAGVCGTPSDS